MYVSQTTKMGSTSLKQLVPQGHFLCVVTAVEAVNILFLHKVFFSTTCMVYFIVRTSYTAFTQTLKLNYKPVTITLFL